MNQPLYSAVERSTEKIMATLSTLCDIQIGFTARGRLEPAEGGVPAIQLRDTTVDGGLGSEPIARFRLDDVPDRYWVNAGDILFRSRGDRNIAIALNDDFAEPAVAVMPLVIIRPRRGALAEYVAWYINQPQAQHHFDACARGTGIRMIPMGCLAELDLPLPDLERQRTIAAIDNLGRREFILSTRLAEKRQQFTNATLLRAARESVKNQPKETAAALRPAKGGTS